MKTHHQKTPAKGKLDEVSENPVSTLPESQQPGPEDSDGLRQTLSNASPPAETAGTADAPVRAVDPIIDEYGPLFFVKDDNILRAIHRPGYRYAKAGVLCLGLIKDEEKQQGLFKHPDPERAEKERRLMAAADALNLYYGRGTVRPATMGFEQRWQMRRERLSPCYTTCLRDVPMARL